MVISFSCCVPCIGAGNWELGLNPTCMEIDIFLVATIAQPFTYDGINHWRVNQSVLMKLPPGRHNRSHHWSMCFCSCRTYSGAYALQNVMYLFKCDGLCQMNKRLMFWKTMYRWKSRLSCRNLLPLNSLCLWFGGGPICTSHRQTKTLIINRPYHMTPGINYRTWQLSNLPLCCSKRTKTIKITCIHTSIETSTALVRDHVPSHDLKLHYNQPHIYQDRYSSNQGYLHMIWNLSWHVPVSYFIWLRVHLDWIGLPSSPHPQLHYLSFHQDLCIT